MEIVIAIGLGLWFALAGLASTVAVFRDFKNTDREDDKK